MGEAQERSVSVSPSTRVKRSVGWFMERRARPEPVSVARTVPLFPGEVPVVGPRGFFLVGGAGSEISRPPECPREEASKAFAAAAWKNHVSSPIQIVSLDSLFNNHRSAIFQEFSQYLPEA